MSLLDFDPITSLRPIPRKQFIDPVDGMALANPVEHIGQPGLRVHAVELGRFQQGVDGSGALPATVGPGEKPILAAHGDSAQGVLREPPCPFGSFEGLFTFPSRPRTWFVHCLSFDTCS